MILLVIMGEMNLNFSAGLLQNSQMFHQPPISRDIQRSISHSWGGVEVLMEISPPLFSVVAVQTLSYQIPSRENPPHIWICLLEKRGWTSDSLYRQSPKKASVRTSNTYRHTHTNTPPSMARVLNSPSLLFWTRVKNENRERLGRVRREQSQEQGGGSWLHSCEERMWI